MPKLATRLRQSTRQLYSKLDSEGPKNGNPKRCLKDPEVDRNRDFITSFEEEQPQWPRAPLEREDPDSDSESVHSSSRPPSSYPSLHTATLHGLRVHHRIRKNLVKPFQDIKFRVHELQVQTRRKCRRLRLRADSFLGRSVKVALGPWQAVQGCLYGLLLVCLGVAEILFSIVFTILYKTLKVVVTTLLIPVIIVIAIVNALRCQ